MTEMVKAIPKDTLGSASMFFDRQWLELMQPLSGEDNPAQG